MLELVDLLMLRTVKDWVQPKSSSHLGTYTRQFLTIGVPNQIIIKTRTKFNLTASGCVNMKPRPLLNYGM